MCAFFATFIRHIVWVTSALVGVEFQTKAQLFLGQLVSLEGNCSNVVSMQLHWCTAFLEPVRLKVQYVRILNLFQNHPQNK